VHRARHSETADSGAFARLYVTGWIVLSGLAIGYLTLLLVQPEWAGGLTRIASPAETPSKSQRSTAQLATEVDSLRRSVADVQRDLAHVKMRLLSRQDETTSDSSRTTPTERSVQSAAEEPPALPSVRSFASGTGLAGTSVSGMPGMVSAASPPLPVTTIPTPVQTVATTKAVAPPTDSGPPLAQESRLGPASSADRSEPKAATAPAAAGTTAPAGDETRGKPKGPVTTVKTAEAAPPSKPAEPAEPIRNANPIETGSLTAPHPQIAFGPAKVMPAPASAEEAKPAGPAGLVLESAPTLDALRLKWAFLNERHSALIGELEARYLVSNRPAGTSYRLLAGPIATTDEARRICAVLRAQKVSCSVASAFSGPTL
jgi:hypothetical protein